MNKACLTAVCVLAANFSLAQSTTRKSLNFDLSKIGMVLDGEQICDDTSARMQDIPSKMMDQILAEEQRSVPVLIDMLGDTRMAKTKEPIVCYWPGMRIGDIAFCLLVGLFTDTKGKTTVPGAGWNDMLGSPDGPAWEQLHGFVRKHGTAALQLKWRRLWSKYGGQASWDSKERCIKLKGQ